MSILFLGGDMRQKYACEYLNDKQIDSKVYLEILLDDKLTKEIKSSKVIVLPLPITKDGIYLNSIFKTNMIEISAILDLISKDQIVIGGKFSDNIKAIFSERGLKYIDYYEDEAFQIQNALLSAEGAIYYAKERLAGCIYGSDVAVLGFGRIGKILSYLLRSQGAKITVYARKGVDCTWSELVGFKFVKIKNLALKRNMDFSGAHYDVIFNTIPYKIINEDIAIDIDKNTLIVDLASAPYCMDTDIAQKYNLNYCRELSIPGRYAPKAAGKILGNTIINILKQED